VRPAADHLGPVGRLLRRPYDSDGRGRAEGDQRGGWSEQPKVHRRPGARITRRRWMRTGSGKSAARNLGTGQAGDAATATAQQRQRGDGRGASARRRPGATGVWDEGGARLSAIVVGGGRSFRLSGLGVRQGGGSAARPGAGRGRRGARALNGASAPAVHWRPGQPREPWPPVVPAPSSARDPRRPAPRPSAATMSAGGRAVRPCFSTKSEGVFRRVCSPRKRPRGGSEGTRTDRKARGRAAPQLRPPPRRGGEWNYRRGFIEGEAKGLA